MPTQTIQSGPFKGHAIRTARKAGQCQYWLGSAGRCQCPIHAGDKYVEGEMDDTHAGGFARQRWCMAHFNVAEFHPSTPDAPQGQTHTPLPWTCKAIANGSVGKFQILKGAWTIALTCSSGPHHEGGSEESNAALIVHAVNTHAQLVGALDGILCHFNHEPPMECYATDAQYINAKKLFTKACEALAHARTGGQAQG